MAPEFNDALQARLPLKLGLRGELKRFSASLLDLSGPPQAGERPHGYLPEPATVGLFDQAFVGDAELTGIVAAQMKSLKPDHRGPALQPRHGARNPLHEVQCLPLPAKSGGIPCDQQSPLRVRDEFEEAMPSRMGLCHVATIPRPEHRHHRRFPWAGTTPALNPG